MTHNKADDPEHHSQQAESRSNADVISLGSEAMLRMWVSWMEAVAKASESAGNSVLGKQAMGDDLAGRVMAEGLQQWTQALARDPLLHSIDDLWNANHSMRSFLSIGRKSYARSARSGSDPWVIQQERRHRFGS